MAVVNRVRIYKMLPGGEEIEVSDACRTDNGKANPWGWSSSDLVHHSQKIGTIDCGRIEMDAPGYRFTETEEEE